MRRLRPRKPAKITAERIRQLPVTTPPALRETVASYTRRLADVNHVHPADLYEALGIPPFGSPERHLTSDRLAAASGYPTWKLEAALPELAGRRLREWSTHSCPRCGQRLPAGPARCYYPPDRPFCANHRMWLGYHDTAVDVGAIPAILSAHRRHRRLIHRLGTKAVGSAFSLAQDIHYNEEDTFIHGERAEILERLRPGRDRIPFYDPALAAAGYPQRARTAGFLLSTHWHRMAQTEEDQPAFYREFGRRCLGIPDYRPEDRSAIGAWAAREAAKSRNRQVSRTDTPHRLGPIDESRATA